MNLCHNRYGKTAEFMVKCQQRLEFMRICRISVLMSLYQQYLQSKKIEKGITQMPNVKYTDSATFRCLENLKEGSLDISLIHTGKEHCPPGHICSMPRDEFIIHFVLDGTGFYSAGGQTWSLTPGQMFVIYPNEPVTYGADETNPWTYAWIGFRGIRAHSMVKECGFSKNQLVLPAPDQKIILKHIDYMLNHKQLSKANDLRRQAYLILLLAELADFHENSLHRTKKMPNMLIAPVFTWSLPLNILKICIKEESASLILQIISESAVPI